jgi:hypothetical protein
LCLREDLCGVDVPLLILSVMTSREATSWAESMKFMYATYTRSKPVDAKPNVVVFHGVLMLHLTKN